jgi:hypothetical protein
MRLGTPNIDQFYASITAALQAKQVPCAITGGLACVEFGVVEHTEDCDLIFPPAHAKTLLELLGSTKFGLIGCQYRKSSPPLDSRWLTGGYTSHFLWPAAASEKPALDVFGVPPRVTVSWEKDTVGRFAGMHTVAEMKRTNRRKDWDQATALGARMLEMDDRRGWLHIFDGPTLRRFLLQLRPPPEEELIRQRPVLQLAIDDDPVLDRAIQTEIDFWTHLDAIRLNVYREAHDRYGRAILRQSFLPRNWAAEHELRVRYAEDLLPECPLRDYGILRITEEARKATAIGIDPRILSFLPPVDPHFKNICEIS